MHCAGGIFRGKMRVTVYIRFAAPLSSRLRNNGEMAERFKAPVLKTGEGKPSVGSNPTLSANPVKSF